MDRQQNGPILVDDARAGIQLEAVLVRGGRFFDEARVEQVGAVPLVGGGEPRVLFDQRAAPLDQ